MKIDKNSLVIFFLMVGLLLTTPITVFAGGSQSSNGAEDQTIEPQVTNPSPSTSQPEPSTPVLPTANPELPSLGTTVPKNSITFQAQDLWQLGIYEYNPEALNEGIGGMIAQGFQPSGLQVLTGQSVIVLFSKVALEEPRWSFLQISPLSDVNAELSAYLVDGWIPLDISLSSVDLHAIFAASPTNFLSWRIISITYEQDMSPEQILTLFQEPLAAQLNESRYLYGLGVVGSTIHLLFVESEFPPVGQRLEMFLYPNDGLNPFIGIDQMVARGGFPAGFGFNDEWVFVPFYF